MSTIHLEPLLRHADRRAVLLVLGALGQLVVVERSGTTTGTRYSIAGDHAKARHP